MSQAYRPSTQLIESESENCFSLDLYNYNMCEKCSEKLSVFRS